MCYRAFYTVSINQHTQYVLGIGDVRRRNERAGFLCASARGQVGVFPGHFPEIIIYIHCCEYRWCCVGVPNAFIQNFVFFKFYVFVFNRIQ